MEFRGFVGPQGLHGVPNGSLLGTLREHISAELGALGTPWFQGGSQTPKRSHLGSLWCHFGASFRPILKCFLHDCFKQNVMSLFKLVVTSGCIFRSSIASIIHWRTVFICYPYSVGVVEAAPPGAAEDHCSCWDKQTRDHHSCCICACWFCECNTCEAFLLTCSSLKRASRSLARQVYFLVFLMFCFVFFVFLFCSFSGRCWKGLLASVGSILERCWRHLGVILVTFLGQGGCLKSCGLS